MPPQAALWASVRVRPHPMEHYHREQRHPARRRPRPHPVAEEPQERALHGRQGAVADALSGQDQGRHRVRAARVQLAPHLPDRRGARAAAALRGGRCRHRAVGPASVVAPLAAQVRLAPRPVLPPLVAALARTGLPRQAAAWCGPQLLQIPRLTQRTHPPHQMAVARNQTRHQTRANRSGQHVQPQKYKCPACAWV